MFGGTKGVRLACGLTAATAMALTTVPLTAMSVSATTAAATDEAAPAAVVDDGFEVQAHTVDVDPRRRPHVELDHDESGEHDGADAGEHGAESVQGSVELVHEDEPELLIVSGVAPETSLAVRSRNDGVWSDWIEVTANPDEAPDGLPGEEGAGGADGVGPIWIGRGADRTEIAVLDGHAPTITVEELEIDHAELADGPTPPRFRSAPRTPPPPGARPTGTTGTGFQSIRASVAAPASTTETRPTIRPRSDWATSSMGYRCGRPDVADNLRAAVVHHTASTTDYSPADVPAIIRGFWRYHTQSNGWCDIAYNFLVDRFGTIWEGREGGIDRPIIGGHAKGFNTWTTGVALIGEFGSAPAYAGMIESTKRLLAWKLSLHGVDPLGWTELHNRATGGSLKHSPNALIHVPTILGHRDLGLTSCPGTNVYNTIGAIRRALASADRVGAPPYVFDRWVPSSTGVALATIDTRGGIHVAGAARQTSVVTAGTPVAIDGGAGKGYVLSDNGRLTPFSGAPERSVSTGGTPVDLVVRSDGQSGWVLNSDGRLNGFGGAATTQSASTAGRAVAAALDDDGRGYVLTSAGSLLAVGGAPSRAIAGTGARAIALGLRADGTSGWVLTDDGVSRGFGGASTHGRPAGSSDARGLVVAGDDSGVTVLDAAGRLWPVGGAPAVMPMASHVGSPIAVDVGDVGRSDLRATDLGEIVTAQHELFLRAAPGERTFERWFHTAERFDRVRSALGMARSDEYAGLIIDDLYRRVLDREADPGGRAGWLGAIRAGMRIETIASAFYGSQEYVNNAGSTDRYVELLYENLLYRSSDPDGHAYWTANLRERRMTPTQVSVGFYSSLESRRDRVTRLYDRILLRDPDPGGLAHWAEQLLSRDDLVLAADLAGSTEFANRATQGS